MGRYTLRHQLFRLPSLIILPITYGLIKLFEAKPALVDHIYSNGFYPWISRVLAGVSRGFSFALTEYVLYSLIIAAVITLIIKIVRLIMMKKDALMRLLSLAITIAITVSYGVFLFYLLWGFNFYRTPIDKRMDLPRREHTEEELLALCIKLADDASALRAVLPEDKDGVLVIDDANALFTAVSDAYKDYGSAHELFKNAAARIKPFGYSSLLSQMHTLGFYSCYVSEPIVNTDQPSLYYAFSAAHESAHYYGWARENEANFVAYMVCCRSRNKLVAYSVTMHALSNCVLRLNEWDPTAAEKLLPHYSDPMLRDIRAYNDYYNNYKDNAIGGVADQLNNSYLTFNGQEGLKSYENDVDLLLMYYDALGLFIAV